LKKRSNGPRPATHNNPDAGKQGILIVEPKPDILSLLAGTFLLQTFRVYSASSAMEAKEAYERVGRSIDVVLLNGNTVGAEGIGVIVAIRRLNPAQKIIVVAESSEAKVNAMKVKGLTIVIMKPLIAEKVAHRVVELIESSKKIEVRHGISIQQLYPFHLLAS
jgi:DNA-binding NtrC family response regulator